MEYEISRRRWLATIGATVATLSPALAQRPSSTAKMTSTKVQARTVQLKASNGVSDIGIVVTAIAAHPKGELLAVAGDDHLIRIMQASTLKVVHELPGHRDLVRTLAFDPAGETLASAGNDGQLLLWSCDDSFRVAQRMAGTPALARVRFSPDGSELAAVGFKSNVYLMGKRKRLTPTLQCGCNDLRAIAFRSDHAVLAVAGRSGDLHLFDPQSGQPLHHEPIHDSRIHDVVFHHDSNVAISVAEDGHVAFFDTQNRKLIRKVSVTTGKLFAVSVIDSQRVAVAGSDNLIRIVNTDSGLIEHKLEGHSGSVAALAVSGGMLFSGGFDATLRRWSIGELVQSRQRIAEVDPGIDR